MDSSVEKSSEGESSQYEFDDQQSNVIAGLASAMRWVSIPLLILGALYAFLTVVSVIQAFQNPASLLSAIFVALAAVIYWSLGSWTRQAAGSFEQVVTTTGRDISHLMEALDNLRKKYSLLSFFIKIYIAIIVVALVAGAIAAIVGAFR